MIRTDKPTVLRWLQVGQREGATHMLLVEDDLAHDIVPVYITRDEDFQRRVNRFRDARQMHIRAIFDLLADLGKQLDTIYP